MVASSVHEAVAYTYNLLRCLIDDIETERLKLCYVSMLKFSDKVYQASVGKC